MPKNLSRSREHHQKRFPFYLATLLIIGSGLLGYAVFSIVQYYLLTHNSRPTVSQDVITYSSSTPDETPPTDSCATYKVQDKYPERIQLTTVNVSGCIERVGIDQNGSIAVPTNIHTAAWYIQSALPGQPGLSIIDGHSGGRYMDGIFKQLASLKPGDRFTITLGSGKVLDYQIYKVQSVPLDQSVEVLLTKDSTVSQLNLIACGGQYDNKTGLYDQRVIVSAKLVTE